MAIIPEGPIEHPYRVKCDVIDAIYDLLLDSGIDISAVAASGRLAQ